ncbi:ERF family protein [endosymbiont GvMRE of Glomus versiforme]|uniref:ERF family protein n=1 Tax=endosymbiont GvMRE of Glomus versiforme TaxID=2039283 RepID=UPI000EE2825A|nr:ERF family protein [endosymbiont GvMRE of Glomus versiforme]RHZ37220.1 Single-stranded DNA-binding protein [endosymbiont GvMRE of Glomus versiforme]
MNVNEITPKEQIVKEKTKKTPEGNNILYKKIQKIQNEVGELAKRNKNAYQNYKYFNEKQVLELLKPLLNKQKLAILLSDDNQAEFTCEKQDNNWFIKYLKIMLIIDTESGEEKEFSFWAAGINQDPAKAKGAAETYAVKYILSKFFLIPIGDENDPDKVNGAYKSQTVVNQPQTKKVIELGKCQQEDCENGAIGKKMNGFQAKAYCAEHLRRSG